MDGPHGRCENVNVLDWMASFANEFYEEDYMDSILRFENLQNDFNDICDNFKIKRSTLPHLKSSVRKKKIHYSRYYSDRSRDMVANAFSHIIQKFNYCFKSQ